MLLDCQDHFREYPYSCLKWDGLETKDVLSYKCVSFALVDPSYESKVLSYTSRAKTSRQDINLVKPVKMARMVVEGNSSKGAGHLASNKSEEEEVLPDVGSQSTQLESASESHDSHVTNAADDILEIEQIKQDILEFTSSSEVVKDFPVTFTAGQRRVVHEVRML